MSLKKTKTPIMGVAALLIILFHLLPMSRSSDILSNSIRYIVTTAYIGVDIFFFMSGYMAFFSDVSDYVQYIKRKFLRIYPMFILSCAIFVLMGGLTIKNALLTLSGIDLSLHGGGSFLWFVPALMIFYLVMPLLIRLVKKIGVIHFLFLTLTAWIVIMISLEGLLTNHSANIFLCRIPVMLLGIASAKYEGVWKRKYKTAAAIPLLTIGILLTLNFGYLAKAEFLISDIFYLIAIPHALGAMLLMDSIFSAYRVHVFQFLGKISLELYCFQMVFGAFLFERVIVLIKNSMLSFTIVFVLVLFLSYVVSLLMKYVIKKGMSLA